MALYATSQAARGQRALIDVFVRTAENEPDRVYGSHLPTGDINDGFQDFTFDDLNKAVDVCAGLIRKNFGLSTTCEALLYLGNSDFRHTIVLLAAIKCGYKACLLDPRDAIEDNIAILEQTGCAKALFSKENRTLMRRYRPYRNLHAIELPSLAKLFAARSIKFKYNSKPWAQAQHDPVVILSSTGNDGSPEPLVIDNGYLARLEQGEPSHSLLSVYNGNDGDFVCSTFAPTHHLGFLNMSVIPVLATHCAVITPPDLPTAAELNVQLALQIIERREPRLLITSPVLLDMMRGNEHGTAALRSVHKIIYDGDELAPRLQADLVRQGVRLQPALTNESFPMAQVDDIDMLARAALVDPAVTLALGQQLSSIQHSSESGRRSFGPQSHIRPLEQSFTETSPLLEYSEDEWWETTP